MLLENNTESLIFVQTLNISYSAISPTRPSDPPTLFKKPAPTIFLRAAILLCGVQGGRRGNGIRRQKLSRPPERLNLKLPTLRRAQQSATGAPPVSCHPCAASDTTASVCGGSLATRVRRPTAKKVTKSKLIAGRDKGEWAHMAQAIMSRTRPALVCAKKVTVSPIDGQRICRELCPAAAKAAEAAAVSVTTLTSPGATDYQANNGNNVRGCMETHEVR